MNRLFRYIITAITVIFSLPLQASEPGDDLIIDTLEINELSVYAKRPVDQTALKITRLDSAILSRHISGSLSDLMSEASPVFVKSLGRGALATVSFRGTAPSHTLVTWNGLELNSPMLGMVDFSEIPVFFIDEVSLVHGNSSLTERPGALGGIIDLSTSTGIGKGVSGSVMQGLGSFGTYDACGRINIGGAKLQSSTRLFYDHSDNDFKFRNYDTPDSINLVTGRKYYPVTINRNADYTNTGLMQQLSYRKSEKEVLDVNLWIQESDRSLPMLSTDESSAVVYNGENPATGSAVNRENDSFFRTAVNYRVYGEKARLTFFNGINYHLMSYRMDRFITGVGSLPQTVSSSHVLSVDNRATYRGSLSDRDEVNAEVRWLYDAVLTSEQVTGNRYDKNRGEISASLSWYHRFGENIRIRSSGVARLIGNRITSPSFSAGAEYHLLPDDRLYFSTSLSSNHHFPTLNDLYFQPGGNPDLRPESSLSQEAGVVWNIRNRVISLSSSVSAYRTNVRDWIIWLPSWKGYWEPFNIESVRTSGIEANLKLGMNTGDWSWKVMTGYALTRSRNFGDIRNWADNSHGKQLPYIPLHSANLNLSVNRSGWSVVYTWNYYSERYTTSSNSYDSYRDSLYPYYMNQVRVGKMISPGNCKIDLSLSVFNLFNETYRSVLQRQMPGRNFLFMAVLNL